MSKYASRKFLVTLLSIVGTVALAYYGKMTGDVALVLTGGIASYNYAQGKIDNNNQGFG